MIQYMNEADRFLRHLDPEADTFVFQTFHDRRFLIRHVIITEQVQEAVRQKMRQMIIK